MYALHTAFASVVNSTVYVVSPWPQNLISSSLSQLHLSCKFDEVPTSSCKISYSQSFSIRSHMQGRTIHGQAETACLEWLLAGKGIKNHKQPNLTNQTLWLSLLMTPGQISSKSKTTTPEMYYMRPSLQSITIILFNMYTQTPKLLHNKTTKMIITDINTELRSTTCL